MNPQSYRCHPCTFPIKPTYAQIYTARVSSLHATHFPKYLYHSPTQSELSSSLFLFTMPGHSRQDTALIHGLSGTEVDKLAEACVEAKSKAYCTFVCSRHSDTYLPDGIVHAQSYRQSSVATNTFYEKALTRTSVSVALCFCPAVPL